MDEGLLVSADNISAGCSAWHGYLFLDWMVSSKFKILLVICHDESRTGGWTLVEMMCRLLHSLL
jgi:hypothetical protein